MLQREYDIVRSRETPSWVVLIMGGFGFALMNSPTDLERVVATRMLTHLPCDGPVREHRGQWPSFSERVILSHLVLMCSNVNVPEAIRRTYFEELGEDNGL